MRFGKPPEVFRIQEIDFTTSTSSATMGASSLRTIETDSDQVAALGWFALGFMNGAYMRFPNSVNSDAMLLLACSRTETAKAA